MNSVATAPINGTLSHDATAISVRGLDFHYGPKKALDNVTMDIPRRQVTAFIGPSGCGKSTLLRCFNRMNDRIDGAGIRRGSIHLDGQDIHSHNIDPVQLRRQVGMVFQKSNPFPRSIYENVAYGLELHGIKHKDAIEKAVQESLMAAALWEEVKDQLHQSAYALSGGQQQRLCIARAIAVKPKVLLMDEPCSALDPIGAARIEELITQLKSSYTIVVVTHNMQQAMRIADQTGLFHLGQLIEYRDTMDLFENPQHEMAVRYITGRIG